MCVRPLWGLLQNNFTRIKPTSRIPVRTKQSISLLLNKERKKDSDEESKRILWGTKETWNSNSVLNEEEGGGIPCARGFKASDHACGR